MNKNNMWGRRRVEEEDVEEEEEDEHQFQFELDEELSPAWQ